MTGTNPDSMPEVAVADKDGVEIPPAYIRQEAFRESEVVTELYAALVEAQGAMDLASKDCVNAYYDSRYADLGSIMEVIRGPFRDNGLAVMWGTHVEPVIIYAVSTNAQGQERKYAHLLTHVTTRIVHKSGQWIETTTSAMSPDPASEGVGNAVQRLRRFGIQCLAGVAAREDDSPDPASRPQGNGGAPRPQNGGTTQKAKCLSFRTDGVACVPFGKKAGTPVTDLEDGSLNWYIGRAATALKKNGLSPQQLRDERAWAVALEAEKNRRNANQPDPSSGPPHPVEDGERPFD